MAGLMLRFRPSGIVLDQMVHYQVIVVEPVDCEATLCRTLALSQGVNVPGRLRV